MNREKPVIFFGFSPESLVILLYPVSNSDAYTKKTWYALLRLETTKRLPLKCKKWKQLSRILQPNDKGPTRS